MATTESAEFIGEMKLDTAGLPDPVIKKIEIFNQRTALRVAMCEKTRSPECNEKLFCAFSTAYDALTRLLKVS